MTDSEEYFLALGKFIDAFSRAEAAVQIVLWQIGNIEIEVAKSIFSGTRTKTATEYIRRIAEAKNIEIPQSISDAFGHLSSINNTRDHIVHFGATEGEDGTRIISNKLLAHTERKLMEFPITPKILNEMSSDLATIMVRLLAHFYGRGPSDTDANWAETLQIARAPFRYKPAQPNNKNHKTQKANRKSQRQRKSSPQ